MAETNDYDPGDWSGYDYSSAKSAYDPTAGRGYGSPAASSSSSPYRAVPSKASGPVVPDRIAAKCSRPLVIVFDQTGSMGTWRDVIGQKLAYLDKEAPSYLGDDLEICFCAIGDAPMGDPEPLQVRPFAKGTELVEHVSCLRRTGGGSDDRESYELAALYLARNAAFEPGARPIVIFIGDEGLHDRVEARHAAWAHVDTGGGDVSTLDIMKELQQKYSSYIVRKPYPSAEQVTHAQWAGLLGDDRVFILQAPERILDVIFGILAIETGKLDYFQKELEDRQTPAQVATVYTSLRTVHNATGNVASKLAADSGKSVMLLAAGAKKTQHLLGGKK